MAAPPSHTGPVGPDTLITVKVIIDGQNRRFKLALRDLGANVLPQKLRLLLAVSPELDVKFDRFSDSAGTYVTLDSNNPSIYKQLYRAAKAKLKLRLRATITRPEKIETQSINAMDDHSSKPELDRLAPLETASPEPRQSYMETVLSQPPHANGAPSFRAFQECRRMGQPSCIVPGAFYAGDAIVEAEIRQDARTAKLSQPTLPSFHDFSAGAFSIDCNHCGKSIPNEHYHCSICEKGDFDLCEACVKSGVNCDGDDHWLIKRLIRNGMVVPSVTEIRGSRKSQPVKTSPPAYQDELDTPTSPEKEEAERTCNGCISQLPSNSLVTCKNCPDFDLCFACFQAGDHGHHPAHVFQPVDIRTNAVNLAIKALCGRGRGLIHAASCDGCDKTIVGVRHKCLSCPDWDFCASCVLCAKEIHPDHRFAALYEPLPYLPTTRKESHRGIYCDGPLCAARSRKSYIRGDRYKCAVCHDTDFCASCEALPTNGHSKTHPLIKIKTPIRHVSITTFQEAANGQKMDQMGDRPMAKNAATETTRATSTNAATQVQTVAEVKPAEDVSALASTSKAREMEDSAPAIRDLQAWYESDSTPDGTNFGPKRLVSQSWTLRNPGPEAWPVGCAVYYIGGDDMRNLDAFHPSSVSSMTVANRSNVLDYSLQPGKTAVFTVLLKSPAREGRAISYWRLKTPEGHPFGHKLWVDISVKSTPIELPIRSAISSPAPAMVKKEVEIEDNETNSPKSSIMIFPKLEKESPVSSIHDVSEAAPVLVEPSVKNEEQELFEDSENFELEDEESDEDGFLTDEEYDILDASDEDFLSEAQQAVAKK